MELQADELRQEAILSTEEISLARHSSYFWGLGFFVFDLLAYGSGIFLAILSDSIWLSLLGSVIAGFSTSGLLIIAHDACHQSLTPNRKLNRFIGTLAFLPALHAYSLWRHGHNFIHHMHTNIRGIDYVWEPLSPKEYHALGRLSRLRYRFFRSLPGHYFYYMFEVWWKRRFIPRRRFLPELKRIYWFDFSCVILWMVLLSTALIVLRCWKLEVPINSFNEWPIAVFQGLILPCCISQMLMSNTEYLHHTHPDICWYRKRSDEAWEEHQARVSVHVQYPQPLDWLVHWIMDHTAHHMQPAIPLYQLYRVQENIDHRSQTTVTYHFKFSKLLEITRKCKLYDDEVGCWTDFSGRSTGNLSD